MTHNSNFCPEFHRAVELIGKRWSGAIVRELMAGAVRFTDLMRAIPDLSERMLCARLRALEEEGIVERRVIGVPLRVEYHLTEKGADLRGVFAAVGEWADRWIGREERVPHPERSTPHPERSTPHPERSTPHPERSTPHPERSEGSGQTEQDPSLRSG